MMEERRGHECGMGKHFGSTSLVLYWWKCSNIYDVPRSSLFSSTLIKRLVARWFLFLPKVWAMAKRFPPTLSNLWPARERPPRVQCSQLFVFLNWMCHAAKDRRRWSPNIPTFPIVTQQHPYDNYSKRLTSNNSVFCLTSWEYFQQLPRAVHENRTSVWIYFSVWSLTMHGIFACINGICTYSVKNLCVFSHLNSYRLESSLQNGRRQTKLKKKVLKF